MVIADVKTKDSVSLMILDNLMSMEYDSKTGEFLFIGAESARHVYLDKGTPEAEVWQYVQHRLRPAYDPRALQTHAILVEFDFTRFQKQEPTF